MESNSTTQRENRRKIMQPDMDKAAQKLALQIANLSFENAKLAVLVEQLQEQLQQAEQAEEK